MRSWYTVKDIGGLSPTYVCLVCNKEGKTLDRINHTKECNDKHLIDLDENKRKGSEISCDKSWEVNR